MTSDTACTTTTDCAALGANYICNNPTGLSGAGICVVPNPLCNFDLILSTLSAHSFDFVVSVDNKKPHVVDASWSIIGPGVLTVTQTKVFNNSGALTFTSN